MILRPLLFATRCLSWVALYLLLRAAYLAATVWIPRLYLGGG